MTEEELLRMVDPNRAEKDDKYELLKILTVSLCDSVISFFDAKDYLTEEEDHLLEEAFMLKGKISIKEINHVD